MKHYGIIVCAMLFTVGEWHIIVTVVPCCRRYRTRCDRDANQSLSKPSESDQRSEARGLGHEWRTSANGSRRGAEYGVRERREKQKEKERERKRR